MAHPVFLERIIIDSVTFFSSDKKLESSSLESTTDSEADYDEQVYKQYKAKDILYQVFKVFGISPISDFRKTTIIQQQVTKAIHLIRLAADEIITSPRTASKDLAKTVLTIDDTEQLLDDLKLLFRTSEYDEQVRLLTLASSDWERVQIEKFFNCNQWQARKALELRESFGFLAKVTHFAGNFPIDPEIVKEIKNFYQDDGVTRQTSNKKEVIHVNKQSIPIRYMSLTVAQAYTLFIQKLTNTMLLEAGGVLGVNGASISSEEITNFLLHKIKNNGNKDQMDIENVYLIPHSSKPINEYFNPKLFKGLYPTLFCYGRGAPEDQSRQVTVNLREHIR
ncbi:unnamed protein product [Rotaria sp. Silwood1]|nr:unnamed protein product [Rotaria sp. Silwood1]